MEDDEELEDEEEEEGMDEEEEEEDVSDFAEEEFYDGEEYEEYDEEEGEELEEEEEEDGDIPPLEGAEDKAEEVGIEEGKMLQAAVQEAGIAGFSVEGEVEGGIEEIQTNRALFGDRMKVQEVESIGVLEEAREGEGEEDESERMDDPTMPQILCVTGGALEEREDAEEEEGGMAGRGEGGGLQEDSSWQQGANETEPKITSEEGTTNNNQQVVGAALKSHF